MSTLITSEIFHKTSTLEIAQYEDCNFKECDFSNQDLKEYVFIDCTFETCNLGNTNLTNAALRNVIFKQCKLIGIHFSYCNPFLFDIQCLECNLNFCSFYGMKLKKIQFNTCQLEEADFTNTDLTEAIFKETNLLNAAFVDAKLNKADFSTALNFMIDPELNSMQGAKFSKHDLAGLLFKYKLKILNV
jgi:fluoroquinolone resistance protein